MSFNIKHKSFIQASKVAFVMAMAILLGFGQCLIIDSDNYNSNMEIAELPMSDSEGKGESSDNAKNDFQKIKNHVKIPLIFKDLTFKRFGHFTLEYYKNLQYQDIPQPPPETFI